MSRRLAFLALGLFLVISARAGTSLSYYGITWYFSADRPTGTFVNGEPWVLGPVTITNINPNPSQSVNGVQHGSMVNPIPNKNFGFDSHASVSSTIAYEAAKNVARSFPFTLQPGDVLVSANSQLIYPTYLKTVCALTVLASPPAEGSFRPSIFGTDRSVKWNVSQVNWSALKNYAAVPSTPSKESIATMVPPLPWFEWASIWSGNSLQPKDNTADGDKQYGRETAAKFGQVGLWLNTSQPLADKRPIAIQIIQNGIDIYNYVKFGGGFYHDGGHKCGRKLPLVMAAMLLNDSDLKTMAANPDIFQEDQQTFFVSQGDVGRVLWVPPPGDSWYGREVLQYRQQDVGMADWGIRHRFEPYYDNRSLSATYRAVVGPGMMGPWIAAYLMGAQAVWNHPPAFAYMERYHTLFGDGGILVSQQNFNREMYAAHKSGGTIVTPPEVAAAPVISPASGYFDTPQTVTMSTTTPSATIRYTLNGATPSATDTAYTAPLTISSTTTVKAVAFASGMNSSSITTASFSFSASPPTFSPPPGGFSTPQTVTLASPTSGATIRYTTDGSDPTASSPVYSAPISVSATTTIKAISIKSGIDTSPIATGIYGIGELVGTETWTSVAFGPRSSSFSYGFDMTPTAANIDAVVGLGGTAQITAFDQLACIIRFNPSGKIDVRNGATYAALADVSYAPGNVYTVRVSVDPNAKTYGVTVATNGGTPTVLAQNFSFRTEQATLANFGRMALYATSGNHRVFNYGLLSSQPTAPTGPQALD